MSRWRRRRQKSNTVLRAEMAGTEHAAATRVLRKAEREQKLAEERLEKSAERYRQEKLRLEGMSDRKVSEISSVAIQADVAHQEYILASGSAERAHIAKQLAEGRLRNAAKRYRDALEVLKLDRR